jgi:uncharacterized protein YjdB
MSREIAACSGDDALPPPSNPLTLGGAPMQNRSNNVHRRVRRLAWLIFVPGLAMCSGESVMPGTGGTTAQDSASAAQALPKPGIVNTLSAAVTGPNSVTLSFTQVSDGLGALAKYDVRFALSPMSWGSAPSVTNGTCATPLSGTATSGTLTCTVLGLTASTKYDFRLTAFRGTLNQNAVFNTLSNIATVTTSAAPTPTNVTVAPTTATVAVGATQALAATVQDQNGVVMSGQAVTWSSSNTGVATVNASGVVTGVTAGSATITATASSKTGSASITVSAPTVALPGVVTNLSATVTGANSVTLSFTQVSDGLGAPAKYDVRFAASPMNWGTAPSVTNGTCATPLSGTATSGTLTCTVLGLTASTKYDFRLTAFRGTLNQDAVFNTLSNIATVTTAAAAATPTPTAVTVAPAAATVAIGATQALTATVKDQNGAVMSGQVVTWSSSNSSVASVSASGVVSGINAGSATITATSSGKTGTAAVSVPAAASQPAGSLLFAEGFEDANLASRGWYASTGSISTTEHAPGSSTASIQFHFLQGATSQAGTSAIRHKFTPSNSVYIAYDVKYSDNWIGSGKLYHPHEINVLSTLDGDWAGPSDAFLALYLEHNYQNGGIPHLGIQDNQSINTSYGAVPNNLIGVTENRSVGGCNGVGESNVSSECFAFSSTTGYYNLKQVIGPVVMQPNPGSAGYKGNWNHVEAYFQLNTIVNGIGQANGVMQYWFNDQLIIDRHDILFRTGARPTIQFNQFLLAPYIGDGSPIDQSMWIDNLRVGTARLP